MTKYGEKERKPVWISALFYYYFFLLIKKTGALSPRFRHYFTCIFYLQPLQVLQFPEHFLVGFPVAESISPE